MSGKGRGSPEAVKKRRTARKLNSALAGGAPETERKRMDGRVKRKMANYLVKLRSGKGKPVSRMLMVSELLSHGYGWKELKKRGIKPDTKPLSNDIKVLMPRMFAAYSELHPDALHLYFTPRDVSKILNHVTTPSSEKKKKKKKEKKANGSSNTLMPSEELEPAWSPPAQVNGEESAKAEEVASSSGSISLPDDMKPGSPEACVFLRDNQGLSQKDIAQVFQLSKDQVYRLLKKHEKTLISGAMEM